MISSAQSIAILGGGSLATSIFAGLRRAHATFADVRVTTRSPGSATGWRELGVPAVATEDDPSANKDAVRHADLVLAAVKPAQTPALVSEIADSLRPGAVVVSLAAGVRCATLEDLLPEEVGVIRAMPNTPAAVGAAMTGLSRGAHATDAQLEHTAAFFRLVGEVLVVEEAQMDAFAAVAGSGPAYVFYFIEQYTRAAATLGFDQEQARVLAERTFAGATELLISSGAEPAELRRRVTSPKGTTERAVAKLEEAELEALFTRAAAAAIERARELSQAV
ncbi:pyrroline-5-carboxylate reductase [Lysobacter korlensis]|uniref:Pyrroline-5-carboxylate reductase n=1 Tax=Lysobacter korlensis TaxID=553636 RepID=A0ABV6RTG9_9GAMM